MAVPFYIPTNSSQNFQFLHILPNTCYFFFFFNIVAIQMDVRWYLTVVLIPISLTVSDAENLFICWLAICISSFQKLLFKSFVYF